MLYGLAGLGIIGIITFAVPAWIAYKTYLVIQTMKERKAEREQEQEI